MILEIQRELAPISLVIQSNPRQVTPERQFQNFPSLIHTGQFLMSPDGYRSADEVVEHSQSGNKILHFHFDPSIYCHLCIKIWTLKMCTTVQSSCLNATHTRLSNSLYPKKIMWSYLISKVKRNCVYYEKGQNLNVLIDRPGWCLIIILLSCFTPFH